MSVDHQDTPEAAVVQALEHILHQREIGADPQRHRAGKVREVWRDAVGHHRKHRHAQGLRSFSGDTFGEDQVNAQAQVGVLLRAADGQHATVVMAQTFFHLHPVHFGNSHPGTPC